MQKQLPPQRQLSQRGVGLQQQSSSKRRKPGGSGAAGGATAVGPATVRRQVSWGPPIVAETDVDLANNSSGNSNGNGNRKAGGKQNGYHGVNRRATTTRN
ncbi:GD13242 [Drosophila simulans]|nr:GD13242 [Drosophila simulans]